MVGPTGAVIFLLCAISSVFCYACLAWAKPVLHELFAPDPKEDQRLGATTSSGVMPAAMETKSGWVNAPDPTESAGATLGDAPYGGLRQSAEAPQQFTLDNLTTRPQQVRYDEPFRPSILPYKRLSAFDGLSANFSLTVVDRALRPVEVGGVAAETEDAFFGDFELDLVANVPVRIPTVGPGTRLLSLQVDPPRVVEVLEDGAENWFMRAEEGGRVRVFVQLSTDRRIFGSLFAPVSRAALRPHLPPFPPPAIEAAAEVLAAIGDLDSATPSSALNQLVAYFRTFEESEILPAASEPLELYREISLSRKGVCRHRAYAFVVTALAWGLPARLVVNEAHAWVEVFDSELWHRIDLGGAASDLIPSRNEPLSIRHRPPSDPFTWPTSERAASTEFERRLAQHRPRFHSDSQSGRSQDSSASSPTNHASSSADLGSSASDFSWNDPTSPGLVRSHSSSSLPSSPQISLRVSGESFRRGTPISVEGIATNDGKGCALSRVDIQVELSTGPRTIGSLATNRNGEFRGEVTLPSVLPVGKVHVGAHLGAGCRTLD